MRRTVKRVIDADTFEVNRKIGDSNRIRLAGVNAPNKNEIGYRAATTRLRGLIGGKTVTIIPVGRSYEKIVGNIRYRRKSVNRKLI